MGSIDRLLNIINRLNMLKCKNREIMYFIIDTTTSTTTTTATTTTGNNNISSSSSSSSSRPSKCHNTVQWNKAHP